MSHEKAIERVFAQTWAITDSFIRIIQDWLTDEQLAELRHKNARKSPAGICYSHDYCDANQAMIDALAVHGIHWEKAGDEGIDIDQIWDFAKRLNFIRIESVKAFGYQVMDSGDWLLYAKLKDGKVQDVLVSPNEDTIMANYEGLSGLLRDFSQDKEKQIEASRIAHYRRMLNALKEVKKSEISFFEWETEVIGDADYAFHNGVDHEDFQYSVNQKIENLEQLIERYEQEN